MEIVTANAAAASEQLSADGDIAVAQLLSMGATRYAGATITAATGAPPPESNVLVVLAQARQVIAATDPLPTPVASALCDLQVVAVLFTTQLAISNGLGSPEILRQLEDELVEALERGTARLDARACVVAAQCLGERALDYMHQIILAEDNRAPIGSDAVERAITELQIAAVAFTTQLAIAGGRPPAPLRRIEKKLVAAFADYRGS